MEELIKVSVNAKGENIISARDLHEFLAIGSNVNTWFKVQAERAMLVENVDYIQILVPESSFLDSESWSEKSKKGGSGQNKLDYAVLIQSAKEIAMLNGSEKGKQARLYFISCEKRLMESTPKTYIEAIEALLISEKAKQLAIEQNLILQPKGDFYDIIAESDGAVDFNVACKLLNLPFGRNTLFAMLIDRKVLMTNKVPYQHYSTWFNVVDVIKKNGGVGVKLMIRQKGLDNIRRILSNLALLA